MILTEQEPLFDAAEVLRFGKDLFYHNNFTSNLKGLDWLKDIFQITVFIKLISR